MKIYNVSKENWRKIILFWCICIILLLKLNHRIYIQFIKITFQKVPRKEILRAYREFIVKYS